MDTPEDAVAVFTISVHLGVGEDLASLSYSIIVSPEHSSHLVGGLAVRFTPELLSDIGEPGSISLATEQPCVGYPFGGGLGVLEEASCLFGDKVQ